MFVSLLSFFCVNCTPRTRQQPFFKQKTTSHEWSNHFHFLLPRRFLSILRQFPFYLQTSEQQRQFFFLSLFSFTRGHLLHLTSQSFKSLRDLFYFLGVSNFLFGQRAYLHSSIFPWTRDSVLFLGPSLSGHLPFLGTFLNRISLQRRDFFCFLGHFSVFLFFQFSLNGAIHFEPSFFRHSSVSLISRSSVFLDARRFLSPNLPAILRATRHSLHCERFSLLKSLCEKSSAGLFAITSFF